MICHSLLNEYDNIDLESEKGIICLEKDTILGKQMCADDFARNVIPTVWDK